MLTQHRHASRVCQRSDKPHTSAAPQQSTPPCLCNRIPHVRAIPHSVLDTLIPEPTIARSAICPALRRPSFRPSRIASTLTSQCAASASYASEHLHGGSDAPFALPACARSLQEVHELIDALTGLVCPVDTPANNASPGDEDSRRHSHVIPAAGTLRESTRVSRFHLCAI